MDKSEIKRIFLEYAEDMLDSDLFSKEEKLEFIYNIIDSKNLDHELISTELRGRIFYLTSLTGYKLIDECDGDDPFQLINSLIMVHNWYSKELIEPVKEDELDYERYDD